MTNIFSRGRISLHLKSDTIQGREVDGYKLLVRDEGILAGEVTRVRVQYQLITGKQQRKTNKTAEDYSPKNLQRFETEVR